MDENLLEFTPIQPPQPSPFDFMNKLVDSIASKMGFNKPLEPEHPADTFDRMTKDGYKLNLITGEYTPKTGGHLEGK